MPYGGLPKLARMPSPQATMLAVSVTGALLGAVGVTLTTYAHTFTRAFRTFQVPCLQ